MTRAFSFLIKYSERAWFALAVIFLIGAISIILPMSVGGIRRIPDLQSYVQFASAYRTAILSGDFPPIWANDNLGFGSVGIRFYPPMVPFLTAFFQLMTGDWYFAFLIILFGSIVIGSFGMYLWVKDWAGPHYGILAAITYSIVPFHLAEIYQFFLYAEFIASAALPFCFLFLSRLGRRGKWADVPALAIACSVLILSHLPFTIIAVFTFAVYTLVALDWKDWRRWITQLFCSALLTAGATAFYWIRVLTELTWVAHSDVRYTSAVPGFGAVLFPSSLAESDMPIYSHLFRHMDVMTILTFALFLPFAAALLISWNRSLESDNRINVATTAAGMFGILILSRLSGFLWSNLTIFQRLQFPWRWLAAVSVLGPASFAFSFRMLASTDISRRIVMVCAASLLVVFAAYDAREIRNAPFRLSRADLNRVANEFQLEETSAFWWPSWARKEAFQSREPVTTNRHAAITHWDGQHREFVVDEGPADQVRVATFYYPYWHAYVNGERSEVEKDENGTIVVPIGEELSRIVVTFEEPETYSLLRWLSVLLWIVLFGSLGYNSMRQIRRQGPTNVLTTDVP